MMAEDKEQEYRRRGGDGCIELSKTCGMWMAKKRRFCSSRPLPSSLYCGNHQPSPNKIRIPCPVDPSHTVLEDDVQSHIKKCSATKQLKHFELQPYFCRGFNMGSDGEEEISAPTDVMDPNMVDTSVEGQSCGAKRIAIAGISGAHFQELVKRIESAYEACCQEIEEEAVFRPTHCSKWWDQGRDSRLPFQEKHVSQQASLLGNLEAFGLLQANNVKGDPSACDKKEWVYVEFGAGRGYLGHMLCDSYGVSSVVLVERRAYRFKADRTLRQILGVSVQRLRTDIEDLNLQGVELLRGRQFVAVSKHLCGPATDLTLRCCLGTQAGTCCNNQQGCHARPILEGIAIATCCHHLCQWRPYVNKDFFRSLGFSRRDFNMITWLTSWAVNSGGEHDLPEIMGTGTLQQAISPDFPEAPGTALPLRTRLSEAMDSLTLVERAALGRKCKHILDYGRLLWLKQRGMDVKLVMYISAAVSPENKLLLARMTKV